MRGRSWDGVVICNAKVKFFPIRCQYLLFHLSFYQFHVKTTQRSANVFIAFVQSLMPTSYPQEQMCFEMGKNWDSRMSQKKNRISHLEEHNLDGIAFSGQRGQWHPTPVLLPGKSHERRSLVGCSPWGC